MRNAAAALCRVLAERDYNPRWLDEMPLYYSLGDPTNWMPGVNQALRDFDLDWNFERRCLTGQGLDIRLGHQGMTKLHNSACKHLQKGMFLKSRAFVRYSRTAQQEDVAVGLNLESPDADVSFDTTIHEHWYTLRQHDRIEARHLAMAAGLDAWFWAAKARPVRAIRHVRCCCGRSAPSLAHLTWNCEAVPHGDGLEPRGRAEERLLLAVAPAEPPRRTTVMLSDRLLSDLARRTSTGFFATDGGADCGWAAAAVATRTSKGIEAIAYPVVHDTTAFAAEVEAMRLLGKHVDHCEGVISDCRGLIKSIGSRRTCGDIEGGRWELMRELRSKQWRDKLIWVPSHGKQTTRRYSTGRDDLTEAEARALNDAADKACTDLMGRMKTLETERTDWLQQKKDAKLRTELILKRAALAQDCLARSLGNQGDADQQGA